MDATQFNLVPNPSEGQFRVELNSQNERINIDVLDVLGQKVQTLNATPNANGRVNQEVSVYQSGLYFVRVHGKNIDFTKKIIITKY